MPKYKNNSKYKTIKQQVSAATRYDPRIGRRVSVRNYSRDQYIRNYKTISLKIAEKAFEERSQRAKTLDKQKTSKEVLEEPNEKWKENINRMDVKGIDDKKDQSYTNWTMEELEDQISIIKIKLRDENPIESEYQKLHEKRRNIETEIFNRKYLKSHETGNYIEDILSKGELDKIPWNTSRYMPMHIKTKYELIKRLKNEIFHSTSKISTSEEEIEKARKENNIDKIMELKVKISQAKRELKGDYERLSIYVPSSIESYKEYQSDELRRTIVNLLNKKSSEKTENIAKIKEKIKSFKIKLKKENNYKKFENYSKTYKSLLTESPEFFPRQKIEIIGSDKMIRIMDPSHITVLTTPNEYKNSFLDTATEKTENVKTLNIENIIIDKKGSSLSEFNGSFYDNIYIKRAKKGFKNKELKIRAGKDIPIIIESDELIYAIAPRSVGNSYLDEEKPDIINFGEKIDSWGIDAVRINREDYKRINKIKKMELIDKAELSHALKNSSKDKVIFEYIINGGK